MSTSVDALTQNQFLQASHHVLAVLEKAKTNVELMLDNLPNIFLMIEKDGRIIRGNNKAAELLNTTIDELLGCSLEKLFLPATWSMFSSTIKKSGASLGETVALELPLDGLTEVPMISWTVRPVKFANEHIDVCYLVFGIDVTTIREYENQLSQIFSTIPLGIIRLDEQLRIVAPVSRFSEHLLGRRDLAGRDIFEVLYQPAWTSMSLQQRENANNLRNIPGFPDYQFDFVRDSLVNLLHFPNPDGTEGKWLGISYEPVIQAGNIAGMLLILEDRTAIERARVDSEAKRKQEDLIVRRFLELKRLEPGLRNVILQDLSSFFRQLDPSATERESIFRALHSIKGTARIAEMQNLKALAHRMEDLLGASTVGLPWINDFTSTCLASLREEWDEFQVIAKALGHEEALLEPKDLYSATVELHKLEGKLMVGVLMTAQKLGKRVRLECDWGGVSCEGEKAAAIAEALMHIVNNAIDHGIEFPADREDEGKPGEGSIRISARLENAQLVIQAQDDGRGVDLERVRSKALENGLLTASELTKLADDQVRSLIFNSGLSTSQGVSEISGRGVGLGAAKAAIEEKGGTVIVEAGSPQGTCFTIRFK